MAERKSAICNSLLSVFLSNSEATKSNIQKPLSRYTKSLNSHDSLMILYCGHGHLDEISETGHWIPVEKVSWEDCMEFFKNTPALRSRRVSAIIVSLKLGVSTEKFV